MVQSVQNPAPIHVMFNIAINISVTFWIFFPNFSVQQMMVFGMPDSILNGIFTYYINSIIISQIVYFYIICYYLKLKTKRINNRIENILKNRLVIN